MFYILEERNFFALFFNSFDEESDRSCISLVGEIDPLVL